MVSKSKITITSRFVQEFSSDITVDNITFHVQTEDMGIKTCKISSRVYREGEVVYARTSDYSHLVKLKDFSTRLGNLMDSHHKSTIQMFTKDQSAKQKQKSHYADEIRQLLRRGNAKSALTTLRYAMEQFPDDPFFLSYYGCLIAVVENKTQEGIKTCRDAIGKLEKSLPFGSEFFYPLFYLNLGRAYLKSKNKKEAVDAFHIGLQHDPDNHDILWELKKLGTRKKPPLPFLKRTNLINKYIGMLITKPTK